MPTSISSKRLPLLLLAALLAACQSVPEEPPPQPAVEAEPEAAPGAVPGAAATEADAADEAAAVAPAEPEPVDFNQQFYEQAIDALKNGETGLALELLRQVSSDAPDKPYVFTNLGLAYFKLEKPELAQEAFTEAIGRDNDDAVAHNHLGVLLRRQGEFETARQHYQKAIDSAPAYAQAYLNLGILFDIYFQDLAQALQHYQKYQSLRGEEDSRVAGWIIDIERRL